MVLQLCVKSRSYRFRWIVPALLLVSVALIAQDPTRDPNTSPTIDPRRQLTIDPQRNPTIDPQRNPTIDPQRNPTIDPRRNPTIDPLHNPQGLYLWNRNGESIGILVFYTPSYFFWFRSSEWTGYAVSNGAEGYNVFSTKGEWLGYMVSNRIDGYNLFDPSGAWIAFTS